MSPGGSFGSSFGRARSPGRLWGGALATLAVLGILLSSSSPGLSVSSGPTALRDPTDDVGAAVTSLQAAQASLETGQGPARGTPLQCGPSDASGSVTCSSVGSSAGTARAGKSVLPSARSGAVMTWDGHDDYVLLFSGSNRNDTWSFSNGVWTDLTPSSINATNSPPGVVGASMTYDASDGYVVLFGGIQKSPPGYLNAIYFNQTWKFENGAWTNITNASDVPPARQYAAMTYDASDGYVLLFGGSYRRGFLNDTWSFSGGVWTNRTPTISVAPPCVLGASMAYDPAVSAVVLFGGEGKQPTGCGSSSLNTTTNTTWSYSGGTWTNLTSGVGPIPGLWDASMAYDPSTSSLLLFGGINPLDVTSQVTWQYTSGGWSVVANSTYPPLSPPARYSANLAYDNLTSSLILFAGLSEPQKGSVLLGDVWSYAGGAWTNLTPLPLPSTRVALAMTYDAKDQYVLLFGGVSASGPLGDSWKYVGGSWLELTPPASPPARYDASITYDARDGYVLLFGGIGTTGYLSDTWAYERGNWTNMTPLFVNETNSPGARAGASMAFDAATQVNAVVLYGGQNSSGYLGDTWYYDKGRWTPALPASSPSARSGASLAYDPASGVGALVLFGGVLDSKALSDTWEFTSKKTWVEPTLTGSAPAARTGAAFVYDSTDGYLLLFGGVAGSTPLGDTWTFSPTGWSEVTATPSPAATFWAGVASDASDSLVLLVGGAASNSVTQNATWAYRGGSWTSVAIGAAGTWPGPPAPPSGSAARSSKLVLEIVVIAVVVLAILILAVLVARRRRGKASPGPVKPFEAPAVPSEGSSPSETPADIAAETPPAAPKP